MAEPDHLEFRGHPRNIQYTTKVARLLNQDERGIAKVLADDSENFLERQYGRLIAVVDLGFSSDTYDISEVLLETLHAEFYSDLNRSVIDSFEHALTAVNQTLADLAAEGQNDWVGKLNAVLAVQHESEIHVTQAGTAEAYLVRGHSATRITEGLTTAGGAATAKTFRNVASGSLEIGDKVLFATNEIFNHMAVNDIRRHLYLHHPARAIRKMADHLLNEGMPGRLAVVVLELTTIDLVSGEPVSHEPDEIILGAPRRHFEALQRFKPFRKDTPLAEYADKAKKYYEKRIRPRVDRHTASTKRRVQAWTAKRTGTVQKPGPRPAAGTPETKRSKVRSSKPASAVGKSFATAGERLKPATDAITKTWNRSVGKTGIGKKISAGFRGLGTKLAQYPWREQLIGSRPVIYRNLIIVGAIIVLISLYASIQAAQNRKADSDIRAKIELVKSKQANAERDYVAKDLDKARAELGDAKKLADELDREKRLRPEIDRVVADVNGSYDRINNVIGVPSDAVADFAAGGNTPDPRQLVISGANVLAYSGNGAAAYSTADKSVKAVSLNPAPSGNIVSGAVTSSGDILLLTDKPSVAQTNPAGATSELAVASGGSWEKGVALDTVQQNVFILDPNSNQVLRHTKTLAGYSKGDPYLNGQVDLKNAVDLVTGAQVYVLKSDGSVLQFTGGNQQNFALKGTPAPTDQLSGKALAVNFTGKTIYLADPKGKRVLEFNTDGAYQRQFHSDAFGDLKDIQIDEKTNTLYVLAGAKLYAVGLGS